MLSYLHSLSLMLEPTDLVNSSDVRLAVSRIVTWTTEPKSVEVRKVFHHLIFSLYYFVNNTHTHPFNGPFSLTTWVSRYQQNKTDLDFTEVRDSQWQWH